MGWGWEREGKVKGRIQGGTPLVLAYTAPDMKSWIKHCLFDYLYSVYDVGLTYRPITQKTKIS